MGVLAAVIETIRGMDEIQAPTVTLHFHLSMQGVVMDSLAWPVQRSVRRLNRD